MSFSVVIAQLHIKNAESGGGAIVYVGKYKHFLVLFKLTSFYNYPLITNIISMYSLIERCYWCVHCGS